MLNQDIKDRIANNKLYQRTGGTEGAIANLRGADLRYANLRYAYLRGADLRGANLSGANLGGANLRYAHLGGANLSGANLGGADLSDANLIGAHLWFANLRCATLTDANVSDANLSDANLSEIKKDFSEKAALQFEELEPLREALRGGWINGSTYDEVDGCACFIGTMEKHTKAPLQVERDSNSPVEQWFLAIKPGDTPGDSQIVAITIAWIDEILAAN